MNARLDALLARPDVWRGTDPAWRETLATGFDALDARIGGGWPLGTLVECLAAPAGAEAMTLCLPALASTTRKHRAALVNPPCLPYAPALARAGVNLSRLLIVRPQSADAPWAAWRCLDSRACRIVLAWLNVHDKRVLRRLQLTAETSGVLLVLVRALSSAKQPSPAALRLAVRPDGAAAIKVRVLKCRGRAPASVQLSTSRAA